MQNFSVPPVREQSFIGYNDNLPAQDLMSGQFTKADNVILADYKIKKVFGSTAVGASIGAHPFDGLGVYENLNTGTKYLVAVLQGASNSSWYSWNGSGNFSAISGGNTFTNGKNWFFETANNFIFGFNQGTEEGDWDGTTHTKNRAGVPLVWFEAWFHNYMFLARTNSNTSRLYWSTLGDPTTYPGAVSTFSVNAAGASYTANDVITVHGGGGDFTITITSVDGSGHITGTSLKTAGTNYIITTGATVTGGTGTGATINITGITITNFVDINPGDGDQIMGLGKIQDELLVFKQNTIWAITGFSGTTFSSTTINTQNTNNRIIGYGCISPYSIVSTGTDVYFFSFLGNIPHVRSLVKTQFATTLEGGIISYDIAGTMAGINLNAVGNIVSNYDGRFIRWGIPTGASTTPNKVIVLDTYNIKKVKGVEVYPWTTRSGINPKFFTISTVDGSAKAYFADSSLTSGLVFKLDPSVYSDNGTAITMDVTSRNYMRDAAREFHHKYLYTKYDTGVVSTVTINANVDNTTMQSIDTINLASMSHGLDSFILDTDTLGGASTNSQRSNFPKMTGKMLQVEFTETSANPVTLYDYEIYSQPKPLRHT